MSSIEDQINEPVHGYDDDDYDVESATQEMLDQLTDRNCELLDENDRLKSEVERLKVENHRLATSKCDQCVAWNRVGQLEDEVERLKVELYEVRVSRSQLDCRYTPGPYADSGGNHCPIDKPCERCRQESEVERFKALVPKLCAKWKERVTEAHAEAVKAESEVERLRTLYGEAAEQISVISRDLVDEKKEVERLNKEVERLTEWQAVLKTLHATIDAAGLDISPCMKCGCLVVCLPDGMPMCRKCAEKQEGGA